MRALLSVDDKTGIVEFARALSALGVELISTGGTATALAAAGVPARTVAEVTGFPEILDGRVKTLHPAIYGGILAKRDDPAQLAELAQHGIAPIDLVVCNLYPFAEIAARRDVAPDEVLESIDIGGVTLLRAAAKNYPHVTVVVNPTEYGDLLAELEASGATSLETRKRLAAAAFQHTALYDTLVADHLRRELSDATLPAELTLGLRRLRSLRYGENPHQIAALYSWGGNGQGLHEAAQQTTVPGANGRAAVETATPAATPTVAGARLLHGKELSFNNLLDLDAALTTVASFTSPAVVVIKHTNPCGLACADSLADAYRRAHAGDPVSAYGGILGFNREMDEETATEVTQIFYEAIIAPSYTPEALRMLMAKKNMRLLATNTPIGPGAVAADAGDASDAYRLDIRRVSGGLLLQTPDVVSDQDVQLKTVTERAPTFEEITDLLFAWKAVQHVKSNAIVLAKKLMVVGVGAGQMNRVYSVQIAVDRAVDRARGSVLASDAFFPFPDGVETAARAGITAIIQPGGSIRDDEVIRMANRYGIAMVTTGQRHFRH